MATYSDVAGTNEAVLVETDDFALVFNRDTQKFYIKWWNSAASTWETRAQIDAANALQEVLPALTDDLKFNFGKTNRYALRYNSTNDTWVLSDEVNAVDILEIGRNGVIRTVKTLADDLEIGFGSDIDYTLRYNSTNDSWVLKDVVNAADILEIRRNGLITVIGYLNDDLELPFGADKDYAIAFDATDDVLEIRDKTNGTVYTFARNQNRNFGVFSKHRYAAETTGVTNGASGSPATVCSISVTASDFQTLLPLNFNATPSGLATGETVTYRITATLDDGTSVDLYNSGAVSTAVSGTIADCDFTGIADGRRIVKLELTAESSETSPSSTSTGVIAAIEYD